MVKKLLDAEVAKRDNIYELSSEATPDPIWVARRYQDEFISLVCALFAYGNTRAIVKYLNGLDMSALDFDDEKEFENFTCRAYRFQTSLDVKEFLISLNRIKKEVSLNELFLKGYRKNSQVIDGDRKSVV